MSVIFDMVETSYRLGAHLKADCRSFEISLHKIKISNLVQIYKIFKQALFFQQYQMNVYFESIFNDVPFIIYNITKSTPY